MPTGKDESLPAGLAKTRVKGEHFSPPCNRLFAGPLQAGWDVIRATRDSAVFLSHWLSAISATSDVASAAAVGHRPAMPGECRDPHWAAIPW